jgi:hypothetical protein
MDKVLTRGEKAAETRRKNKIKAEYQRRAALAWETRRKKAKKAGLINAKGEPTKAGRAKRTETALAAWATRRVRYGETGIST